MTTPTIVAPGGSYQKALTAARFWAEEVYMGVPFTSLRMRQNKILDFDDLKKTVDAVHWYWARAFLTMNIFPRNTDIKIFESTVERISDVGADAIIFSDPWTFHILKKYLPNTHLHLSTQTSTLNYSAVKFWYDLGVKRVVLARELHIKEIEEIKKQVPGMELEVFVHWAMCMSYSWRCLLGDYMNWRPGNKWECSHACRFKYKVWLEEDRRPWKLFQIEEWEDNTNYILSSKDLCTIDRLAEILPYVDAMKIEGRSKSEFYVGAVVKAYKHVRDAILNWTPIDENIKNLVNVIPHREYWSWFLFNDLKDYPEWENLESFTTKTSPGPLFNRNYFWIIESDFIEKDGKKYFKYSPKEVVEPGMELQFLSPNKSWNLIIKDIVNEKWKVLEKWTCNTPNIYVYADYELQWGELLYKDK